MKFKGHYYAVNWEFESNIIPQIFSGLKFKVVLTVHGKVDRKFSEIFSVTIIGENSKIAIFSLKP